MGTGPQNKGKCYNSKKFKINNVISKKWEADIKDRKYASSPFMEKRKC